MAYIRMKSECYWQAVRCAYDQLFHSGILWIFRLSSISPFCLRVYRWSLSGYVRCNLAFSCPRWRRRLVRVVFSRLSSHDAEMTVCGGTSVAVTRAILCDDKTDMYIRRCGGNVVRTGRRLKSTTYNHHCRQVKSRTYLSATPSRISEIPITNIDITITNTKRNIRHKLLLKQNQISAITITQKSELTFICM